MRNEYYVLYCILAEKQQESRHSWRHADDVLHEHHGVRKPNRRGDVVAHVPETVSDFLSGPEGTVLRGILVMVIVAIVGRSIFVAQQSFVFAVAVFTMVHNNNDCYSYVSHVFTIFCREKPRHDGIIILLSSLVSAGGRRQHNIIRMFIRAVRTHLAATLTPVRRILNIM